MGCSICCRPSPATTRSCHRATDGTTTAHDRAPRNPIQCYRAKTGVAKPRLIHPIKILKGAEADGPRRPRMYWTLAPSGVAEARSVPLFTGYAFVPLKIGPQSHATPARLPRDAREAPVRLPLGEPMGPKRVFEGSRGPQEWSKRPPRRLKIARTLLQDASRGSAEG